MSQNKYLTGMANVIIDKNTGLAMEYRQNFEKPEHGPVQVKPFANELVSMEQVIGGRVDGLNNIC